MALICCLGALGVAGCGGSSSGGGGASGTVKLGTVVSFSREGSFGNATAKPFKYKTAVISVRQAGPNDLKNETLIGSAPKDDVAFYVTQRVTGVQSNYVDWRAQSPDLYDTSGAQATPLATGTDIHECIDAKQPADFGPGKSFEICDIYLLPPKDAVGKVVLPAEGPGQNDVTWKVG